MSENNLSQIYKSCNICEGECLNDLFNSVLCSCDFASGRVIRVLPFSRYASPATAANCILTDHQRRTVNHQPVELEGKRVRGCSEQIETEKMMKSKINQMKGE